MTDTYSVSVLAATSVTVEAEDEESACQDAEESVAPARSRWGVVESDAEAVKRDGEWTMLED